VIAAVVAVVVIAALAISAIIQGIAA